MANCDTSIMDGDLANKNMKGMVISYKPVEDIVKNYLESPLCIEVEETNRVEVTLRLRLFTGKLFLFRK